MAETAAERRARLTRIKNDKSRPAKERMEAAKQLDRLPEWEKEQRQKRQKAEEKRRQSRRDATRAEQLRKVVDDKTRPAKERMEAAKELDKIEKSGSLAQPKPRAAAPSGPGAPRTQTTPREVSVERPQEAPAPNTGPASADEIKRLQQVLTQGGFNPGPVDGVMGPRTQAALQRYQRTNGLRVTGQYDPATRTAVNSHQETQQAGQNAVATAPAGGGRSAAPPQAGPTATESAATSGSQNVAAGDVEKEIRDRFPQYAAYLDHAEIGPILREAAEKGMTGAELKGRVQATAWWKNTSGSARIWEQTVNQDPATAHQRRNNKAGDVDRLAKTYGIQLHPLELLQIADNSIKWGWSDSQVNAAVVAKARATKEAGGTLMGGQLKATTDQLKKLARDFLVPLPDKDAEDWALRIAEGTSNEEGYKAYLRGLSKERFSWLAPQIDAGYTPGGYFASHKGAIAQVLELSADQIDLMDRKWSAIIDHTDAKGQRRAMTLGEAEDWARKQPEYMKTDAANAKGYGILRGLLGDMELI